MLRFDGDVFEQADIPQRLETLPDLFGVVRVSHLHAEVVGDRVGRDCLVTHNPDAHDPLGGRSGCRRRGSRLACPRGRGRGNGGGWSGDRRRRRSGSLSQQQDSRENPEQEGNAGEAEPQAGALRTPFGPLDPSGCVSALKGLISLRFPTPRVPLSFLRTSVPSSLVSIAKVSPSAYFLTKYLME